VLSFVAACVIFYLKVKKIARNISRNTALVIDEHFVPSFKPAKIFVNKIKNSDKVKQLEEKSSD
jgi:DNA-binding protein HU-beta